MATRRTFNDAEDQRAAPEEPARRRFICKAHGCEMTGAIDGLCCYHWSAHSGEWQRVTGALLQCRAMTDEINHARKVLNDLSVEPESISKGHIAAMERIRGHLTTEQAQFLAEKKATDLRTFAYHLEMLVGQAVQRVLTKRKEERAKQQSVPATRRPADIYDEMYP